MSLLMWMRIALLTTFLLLNCEQFKMSIDVAKLFLSYDKRNQINEMYSLIQCGVSKHWCSQIIESRDSPTLKIILFSRLKMLCIFGCLYDFYENKKYQRFKCFILSFLNILKFIMLWLLLYLMRLLC